MPDRSSIPSAPEWGAEGLWTRLARRELDALLASGEPVRALIVGSAGSGKSGMLRRLRHELESLGRTAAWVRSPADLVDLPAATVALVDDAHCHDDELLAAIDARLDDPDAGIVVDCRPWPRAEALDGIARRLERDRPAIVLGQVTVADVRSSAAGALHSEQRLDSILQLTGGVSWLTGAALVALGREEDDEAARRTVRLALREPIAHRLQMLEPALRDLVVSSCLEAGVSASDDDLVRHGHAEGLLQRSGQPVPVVRYAVRTTISVDELLRALTATDAARVGDLAEVVVPVRDERLATMLLRLGDETLAVDPRRAEQHYRSAGEAGADRTTVVIRRARAYWQLGDLDTAGALLDGLEPGTAHADRDRAVELQGTIWAERGLADVAAAAFTTPHTSTMTSTHAFIARFAAADPSVLDATEESGGNGHAPSALDVSLRLIRTGLAESLVGSGRAALSTLVRASETYTASQYAGPIPELPAVIAAIVAIDLGEIEAAHAVLHDATQKGHGGPAARARLLLWTAWVALQRERRQDAQNALDRALSSTRPLSARDRLLADAIRIAMARRYSDMATLTAAWAHAQESLLRARFDLFNLLPLGEFIVTAARLKEDAGLDVAFAQAQTQLSQLGTPHVWSVQLHWAGIQQGILLNAPERLKPHARALVAAAPASKLAAMMAQAGRVWTSVLAGSVDADAVEQAALGLASVGLAWDGARLAGHGASRAEDRRVISRLLACARQLHPRDDAAPSTAPAVDDATPSRQNGTSATVLSAREREVALLVLRGKTYAEIGDAIFISPRTAEHHIARIRRRLGATSRSDLIEKLRVVIEESEPDDEMATTGVKESS